ncbi:hypothetical protein CUZ96_2012 [Enterococcus lactis]|nr:hypothetical protein [Enterococcus lactis]MBL5012346.1 hypothetical protein [Enterococcus lactis]
MPFFIWLSLSAIYDTDSAISSQEKTKKHENVYCFSVRFL